MTPEDLRELCLGLPGSVETFPFGPEASVFKVGDPGRMFAVTTLDAKPLAITLKCDPEESLALQAMHVEITPGYHMNKKHWITVRVSGSVDERLVGRLVEDSYRLVRGPMARSPRVRGPESER